MALYVFDAYGTLFNVHAAAERYKESIGPRWQQLSQTWRAKHIEYSWHASMIGKRATFWSLAERSLDFSVASVGGGVSSDIRRDLLASYRRMDAYPEVREVLKTLKTRDHQLAILSNGDPDMLADAMRASQLEGLFDAVFSVATVGVFKPSMTVYQMVMDHFGGTPSDVSFQSSNRWDIAGAKAFGFGCIWINRTGGPDEYPDLPPDLVVSDLRALLR